MRQPARIAVALIALAAGSGASLVSAGSSDGRQTPEPNPGTRSGAPVSLDHRLPKRGAVARTMQHDDPTIQRALTVLGQAINPIALVSADEARAIYARTPGAGAPSAAMNAFRAPGDMNDPNIYVNRASAVFRTATQKPTALALLKLAATLVHEQIHNTDGDHAAYRLQSDFVRGKLGTLSARERQEARRYLQTLDARAARAQIDWLRKARDRG